MLRQTEWQQQIESLLSRVELKDLLSAIDYEEGRSRQIYWTTTNRLKKSVFLKLRDCLPI